MFSPLSAPQLAALRDYKTNGKNALYAAHANTTASLLSRALINVEFKNFSVKLTPYGHSVLRWADSDAFDDYRNCQKRSVAAKKKAKSRSKKNGG